MPSHPASCLGRPACGAPCDGRPDTDELALLASAVPEVLAHRTLNGISVVAGIAETMLLEGAASDGQPRDGRDLRDMIRRRAPVVGWSCGALAVHVGSSADDEAVRWVAGACRVGRSPHPSDDELRAVACGPQDLVDELTDVIRGHR